MLGVGSIVPKSCRLGAAKKTSQEYNKLYGVRDVTGPMLTDKSIRYAIKQIKMGRGTKVVAEELNISQRHVQRLWAEYIKTEKVQGHAGRPKKHALSNREIEMILDIHRRWPDGV